MCGINAVITLKKDINIIHSLINSLKQLQNRGYDSAGLSIIHNNEFNTLKYASTNKEDSIEKLEKNIMNLSINEPIYIGMAHTRWATHGGRTDANSHPHISNDGLFQIIHNGIIENYSELKRFLMVKGFCFNSQTDTEIIVNLIAYHYNISDDKSDVVNTVYNSITNTLGMLEGTWGLVILCKLTPNHLYAVRHGSPILLSISDDIVYISSEQSGFCGYINNYIVLDSNDLCQINIDHINNKINTQLNKKYIPKEVNNNTMVMTPEPYRHWTIKEINEQVESSLRAISLGGRLRDDNSVNLGGLREHIDYLMDINNIILLGCGTSYYAGMIGSHYFKELNNFNTVQVFDGAEFSERDIPKIGKTCFILLSQSGETKDLHRCINIGRENNIFLLGIVNVVDSMIAREVDCGIYLNAGREVGVASTKAFTSQVIILSMLSIWFAQIHNINENKRKKYIKNLRIISYHIKNIINRFEEEKERILELFRNKNNMFILGKGKSEAIAKEGALKIKEISYIHAEGYSASSLKHGPFALLDDGCSVILIAPYDEYYYKCKNTYEEVKSRIDSILVITNYENNNFDHSFMIPHNETYCELLSVIPLQLCAYYLSIEKNINPDKPRNLAKVVTVE
jgi:glucosamine--fructose-6-phosphate aminotransferase (isomerizing)